MFDANIKLEKLLRARPCDRSRPPEARCRRLVAQCEPQLTQRLRGGPTDATWVSLRVALPCLVQPYSCRKFARVDRRGRPRAGVQNPRRKPRTTTTVQVPRSLESICLVGHMKVPRLPWGVSLGILDPFIPLQLNFES